MGAQCGDADAGARHRKVGEIHDLASFPGDLQMGRGRLIVFSFSGLECDNGQMGVALG